MSQCPNKGVRSWGRGGEGIITLGWWKVWADVNALRMSEWGDVGKSALATSILSVVEERVTSGLQGEFKASVEGLDQSLCLIL